MEVNVVLISKVAELADESNYLDGLFTEAQHYLWTFQLKFLQVFNFIWYLLKVLQRIVPCVYLVAELMLELGEIVDIAVVVFELVDKIFLLSNGLWILYQLCYHIVNVDLFTLGEMLGLPMVLDHCDQSSEFCWISKAFHFVHSVQIIVVGVNRCDAALSLLYLV